MGARPVTDLVRPDLMFAAGTLRNRARLLELEARRAPEVRDPSAATMSVRYLSSPGQPMIPEWDAETAIRWGFYANVIVYRAVQVVANTLAACPFLAGPRPPKRPGMVAETVDSSRLSGLLGPAPGGPAPKLSARRLWAWTVAQRIVTGRSAWEVEVDGDQVSALWPLVSASLRPIPTRSGSEWFSGFEYGPRHNPKRLAADRVVYGWDPGAQDFREPESRLQAARLDIDVAVMMDRYNVGFLRNDARPAAVVVTEAFANDDDYQAFKTHWQGEYGGPDAAGKTAFLEASQDGATPSQAIDVKVLGLSQRDARFIEQHKASLERVAIAVGVPWSRLDASGRTFDNAGEEDHNFWESTMLPLMSDFADEVNMQLAPRLGREVGWFDVSHVRALQPERPVAQVGANVLLTARVATWDEARIMVGLPPLPDGGGDRFLTDDEVAVLTGHVLPVSAEDTPVEATPEPEAPPVAPANVEPVSSNGNGRRHQRHVEDSEVRRTRIWRATDAVVRSLESRWERAWRRLFARQLRSTLNRLEGNRGKRIERRQSAGDIFDAVFWRGESTEEAAALYELVMSAGFARVSDAFGISFDLEAPFAQMFVESRANQLAGQVTETTYRAIQEALAKGVGSGAGIPELAESIRHVFDVASSARATMIARTEVISAFNASTTMAAQELPADVAAGREWIATRDARVRDEHAAADGQTVGVNEPFIVGGEQLAYPGDPAGSADNTVNCRCAVAILTPDEMAGRSRAVSRGIAAAVLAMVHHNGEIDEMAMRRAMREGVS